MSTDYNFEGKVAIITGSSSGIGEAIAVLFARHGCRVTITGRIAENVQKVAAECTKVSAQGHAAHTVVGNMTDEATVKTLIDTTIAKFGRLDILVNNAGGMRFHDAENYESVMGAFDYVMALNLRSVVQLTTLALPHLEVSKGNIINISSIAAIVPSDGLLLPYCMSKAALDMYTKSLAIQVGSKGIRVNSINPGPITTAIFRDFAPPGVSLEQMQTMADESKMMEKATILGRSGKSIECAKLALFLASDAAAFITANISVIDGGMALLGNLNHMNRTMAEAQKAASS